MQQWAVEEEEEKDRRGNRAGNANAVRSGGRQPGVRARRAASSPCVCVYVCVCVCLCLCVYVCVRVCVQRKVSETEAVIRLLVREHFAASTALGGRAAPPLRTPAWGPLAVEATRWAAVSGRAR